VTEVDHTRRFWIGPVLVAAFVAAITACSSTVITAVEPQSPDAGPTAAAPTATAVPTSTAVLEATPEPAPEPKPTPDVPTVAERLDWILAVAGYAPLNVDGQDGVTPPLFGSDDKTQTAGFDCYEDQLAELIDLAALRKRVAATDRYIDLSPADSLSARTAVANCLAADEYRAIWIANNVWAWNTYSRNPSVHARLSHAHPCFAPIFDSPEEFVATLITEGFSGAPDGGLIGPFDCRAAIGISDSPATTPEANPTPNPFGHHWTACNSFDSTSRGFYRVVNIPDDDADGGLVAHLSPGVDAVVTAVLPEGTGELQISGCQIANDGGVWWLVDDQGWVNSYYLEAVSGANPEWHPGLSDPLDSEWFTALVGLEAPDLDTLTTLIGEALGGEAPSQVSLINFVALDAQGGTARFNIGGLQDDSVSGYRLDVPLAFVKDETAADIAGLRIASVTARAFCMRGVSDSGRCV